MKTKEQNKTTWSECQCEACTSKTETKTETKTEAKGFKNLQGDGPSGFDFYQDTKWTC